MNRSNAATLIVVGLASLVVGAVIAYFILKVKSDCPPLGPDEKANYVLHFGTCNSAGQCSRVSVVSILAFKAALQTGTISTFTSLNKREASDPSQGVAIGGRGCPGQGPSLRPARGGRGRPGTLAGAAVDRGRAPPGRRAGSAGGEARGDRALGEGGRHRAAAASRRSLTAWR